MILWRAALAAAMALQSTPAEAHAFGARYDLPLPLELYLIAAGMAVAASFLGALVFLRTGRARTLHLDLPIPARVGHALSTVLGLAGVLGLAILLGAAFAGPQEAVRNLATVWVWVIWWVGFLLFSALVVEAQKPPIYIFGTNTQSEVETKNADGTSCQLAYDLAEATDMPSHRQSHA
jgi:hypothetical protein